MIARVGSFVVALLCCLLTFVASASAECAWVLWLDNQSTDTRIRLEQEWHRVTAYPTADECIKAIDLRETDARKAKWIVGRSASTNLSTAQPLSNSPYRIVSGYQCLPDTIDPRGPKGK